MNSTISSEKQGKISQKYLTFIIFTFLIISIVVFVFYPKIGHIDSKQIDTNQIDINQNTINRVTPTLTIDREKNNPPKSYLIKTAFIPQAPEKNWDQPWQDACEESALLTAFYYYKKINPSTSEIKDKILEIIEYEQKQSWQTSINIQKIQQIYNQHLGLKSDIIIDPKIDDIKDSILNNHPVLIPSAGKILFKENKYFNDGGPIYHALVVLGFDDNKKEFVVHDVGTKRGEYFRYSYSLLMESIHDFPESNNSQDILNGSKKVLVLKNNEN